MSQLSDEVRVWSGEVALETLKLNRGVASVSIKTFDAKCFFVPLACKTANISNLIPLIFQFHLIQEFEALILKVKIIAQSSVLGK